MDASKVETALKGIFRPEFLNRVDEIVTFDSLTEEQLLQIVDLLLKATSQALLDKEINLNVSEAAKKYILSKGTDLKYGARPLRRAIQRYIEDEISEIILRNEIKATQTLNIEFVEDKLTFNVN